MKHKFTAACAVAFIAVLLTTQAEAKHRYHHYRIQYMQGDRIPLREASGCVISNNKHASCYEHVNNRSANVIQRTTSTEQISARRHHYGRTRYVRGGACDGFQRCRCGTTAARHFGLPYNYRGFNLKLAWEWQRAFPRTSFGIGVAGVKPHHVLTVVGGSSCAAATVYDDAGTYQRNVCGMTFVAVNGNVGQGASFDYAPDLTRIYHAKWQQAQNKYRSHDQMAFYEGPGSLNWH